MKGTLSKEKVTVEKLTQNIGHFQQWVREFSLYFITTHSSKEKDEHKDEL